MTSWVVVLRICLYMATLLHLLTLVKCPTVWLSLFSLWARSVDRFTNLFKSFPACFIVDFLCVATYLIYILEFRVIFFWIFRLSWLIFLICGYGYVIYQYYLHYAHLPLLMVIADILATIDISLLLVWGGGNMYVCEKWQVRMPLCDIHVFLSNIVCTVLSAWLVLGNDILYNYNLILLLM